jgi:hypothetical protein
VGEPLGRLHDMLVRPGLSRVRSPLSLLLSLETVTCRLALTSIAIVFPLTTGQESTFRLYYTAILRKLGHGLTLTSNGKMDHNLTQRHSFSNESSRVAFNLGAGSSISPFDFSSEAPPNPGRPPAGPREPGEVPNEAREQPWGVRSPSRSYNAPDLSSFPFNPTSHPPRHSFIYLTHRFLSTACL